jgi:hypothetical protein
MWGQKGWTCYGRTSTNRLSLWSDQKLLFLERNPRFGNLFLYLLAGGVLLIPTLLRVCLWKILYYMRAFATFPVTHILCKHPVWRICLWNFLYYVHGFETSYATYLLSKYPALSTYTYFCTYDLSNAFHIYCKNCHIEEEEDICMIVPSLIRPLLL